MKWPVPPPPLAARRADCSHRRRTSHEKCYTILINDRQRKIFAQRRVLPLELTSNVLCNVLMLLKRGKTFGLSLSCGKYATNMTLQPASTAGSYFGKLYQRTFGSLTIKEMGDAMVHGAHILFYSIL